MHVDHQPSKPNMPAPRFAIGENVARTMSSREIAELVGSRHSDVMRTIDRLLDKRVISGCTPSAYTQEQNGQARFTPKGVQWVAGLWAAYRMNEAA